MRTKATILGGLLAASWVHAQVPPSAATVDKNSKAGGLPGVAASAVPGVGLHFNFVPVDPQYYEGAKSLKGTFPKDGGVYLMVPTAIPGYSNLPMDYATEPDLAQLMQAQTRAIKDLSDRLKTLEDRLKLLEKGKP